MKKAILLFSTITLFSTATFARNSEIPYNVLCGELHPFTSELLQMNITQFCDKSRTEISSECHMEEDCIKKIKSQIVVKYDSTKAYPLFLVK